MSLQPAAAIPEDTSAFAISIMLASVTRSSLVNCDHENWNAHGHSALLGKNVRDSWVDSRSTIS